MKKLCMVMMVFLLGSCVKQAHGSQILDVCLLVDKSNALRRHDVDMSDLKKYGRFGLKEPLPFDEYFSIKSACYKDYFDNVGCVEIEKDLINQVPTMICGLSLSKEDKKQFRFPKFVSRSFIDDVENSNKRANSLTQKIYEKNGRSIILRYRVEYVTADENQTMNGTAAHGEIAKQSSISSSNSISDFGLWILFLVLGNR